MLHPLYINWNPDPELLNLFGFSLRYYGLLWVVGIALAYMVVQRIYADRKIGQTRFEPLFLYCFVGILVGARLGHCLFYDPTHYYISSMKGITEMLLPIQIQPDGGWKFTGYEGLASHGGTAGLMFTLWLYCRKYRMHYIDVVDMIAVATPITACCIRLANLMNSEIIGMPTTMPWGFVFERVTHLNGAAIALEPRHPAQLYEALAYFALFIIMLVLYSRGMKAQGVERPLRSKQEADDAKTLLGLGRKRGFYFGLCLTYIFTFRFFIEFLKENQGAFEDAMTFNMGQLLSLPFVAIGLYFMGFYGRKRGR